MLLHALEAEQPYDGLKQEEILEQKKQRQKEILELKKNNGDHKSLLGVEGIYIALAEHFNKEIDTIKGIFAKDNQLPPKRTSADDRKKFKPKKKKDKK